MRRLAVLVLVVILGGCGAGGASTHAHSSIANASSTSRSATSASSTGGSTRGAGHAPRMRHVVWIWFENEDQSNIIGNGCCTYFTHLAHTYGDATNYYALGHFSADNYTGATGGVPCCYDDSYQQLSNQSIFSQLPNGQSRSLLESMPAPCDTVNSGDYAVRHNPEVYYVKTLGPDCTKYDVPYTTGSTPDLSAKFTFVAPNLCNDAHNCSTATADRWLAGELPRFMSTPQYRSGTTAIFITFDEGSGDTSQGPTSPPGNHIPMIVVSPRSSGQDGTQWTHYSLLGTTEQLLGLPKLGGAASAPTMCGHFGLTC